MIRRLKDGMNLMSRRLKYAMLLSLALTFTVFFVFDLLGLVNTPISPANHWVPEYVSTVLILYFLMKEKATICLTIVFMFTVIFISMLGLDPVFPCFTLTLFLSTFPAAYILTKIRKTR